MKLLLEENVVVGNVVVANKFTTRLFGLMFKRDMNNSGGLLIPGCNWVHTLFMRFPLDIIYLNKEHNICHIDRGVRPWRFCLPVFGASSVIELSSGTADALALKKGDILRCIN